MASSDSSVVARLPPSDAYIGRFAPSPTGSLHFGSLIAALGSYLQARANSGRWLLRIEDLDQPRVVPDAAEHIIATLSAFGFEWDGAIEYQSRHHARYADAIEHLRARGVLYECSCSRTQIAARITDPETEELRYPGTCRMRTTPHPAGPLALRYAAPNSTIEFIDRIQGRQRQNVASSVGDFVVRRRDGLYAYHLAVVVDDAEQRVTEVVRGADLLSSTPRQIALQKELGFATPMYCHLPLAVDAQGRKLSKSTQSLAIDPASAIPTLWSALAFLGHTPPAELRSSTLATLWDWAMRHWNVSALTGCMRKEAPAPDSA